MTTFPIRGVDTAPTYGIGDFVVVIQEGKVTGHGFVDEIKYDRQGWSYLVLPDPLARSHGEFSQLWALEEDLMPENSTSVLYRSRWQIRTQVYRQHGEDGIRFIVHDPKTKQLLSSHRLYKSVLDALIAGREFLQELSRVCRYDSDSDA